MSNTLKSIAATATDKAAAILAAEAANAEKLSNYIAVRDNVLRNAAIYGRQSARGAMSLTKLAFLFNESVRSGVMSEGDAGAVYRAYGEALNAAVDTGSVEIDGVKYAVTADKIDTGEKSSAVSMFRSFGRPAVVAQGLGLYQRVITLRQQVGKSDLYGSAYSCMVHVNRGVTDDGEASLMSEPDILAGKWVVTDERIVQLCTKEAPAKKDPKTFDEKLAALIVDCGKLVKAGDAPELRAAYDLLGVIEATRKIAKVEAAKDNANGAPAPVASDLVKVETMVETIERDEREANKAKRAA